MSNRLQDKVTIITGATSGIGEVSARVFIAQGAKVILAGRRADKGQQLAQELGDNASFVQTDITNETEIKALVEHTVDQHGRLDVLFNNAGGGAGGTPDSVTETDINAGMQLLFAGPVLAMKYAIIQMRKNGGGSIINNSSIAGHRYRQGSLVYSAAKAALTHYSKLAGVETGKDNIRVNCISPGAIATPIFYGGSSVAEGLDDEANQRKMAKLQANLAHATPTPRSGISEDIALAAVYLASDESSFVNCHDLVVDGGRIAMFNEGS